MKRFQVYLTLKQWTRLFEIAKESGMSVAEHIRRAIDTYLERFGS